MLILSNGVLENALSCLSESSPTWSKVIQSVMERDLDKYKFLDNFLTSEYNEKTINPDKNNIFKAFALCPFEKTRVVISGQDPYPNHEHAMGLAFSVPYGTKLPPSLKNIYKEINDDTGSESATYGGDLSSWAFQGVLLINTTLTVEAGKPGSHKRFWNGFGAEVLSELNEKSPYPLCFILWGNDAHNMGQRLEKYSAKQAPRKFIYSAHPSPLSAYRGFFGSKPFSAVNEFLTENGEKAIIW